MGNDDRYTGHDSQRGTDNPAAPGNMVSGVEAFAEAKERMEDEIACHVKKLGELEAQIKPYLAKLPSNLFTFTLLYYFSGVSLPEISRVMDRTERMLYRYKQEIRKWFDEQACE